MIWLAFAAKTIEIEKIVYTGAVSDDIVMIMLSPP